MAMIVGLLLAGLLVYFGVWLPAKWEAKEALEEQNKPEAYWQRYRR